MVFELSQSPAPHPAIVLEQIVLWLHDVIDGISPFQTLMAARPFGFSMKLLELVVLLHSDASFQLLISANLMIV